MFYYLYKLYSLESDFLTKNKCSLAKINNIKIHKISKKYCKKQRKNQKNIKRLDN